jgi:hypothetical protein
MATSSSSQPSAAATTTLLEQLRKHLENELAVQKKLLAIAEQMGPKLMLGDAKAIAVLVTQQEEPSREAARLGTIRSRLSMALAAVFQLDGTPSLSRILPRAPEGLRADIERVRQELVQICNRLGRQAERNLVVARQGLSLIREVLGDAIGAKPAMAYDRRGLVGPQLSIRGTVVNIRG